MRYRVTKTHGLLYYAVNDNEALVHDTPDPTRLLDMSVFADGDTASKPDWPARWSIPMRNTANRVQ